MSDGIYEPGADLEDDGVLEPSDTLDDDDLSSDVLDTGIAAPDRYAGANRFGTTLSEQRQGESLDQRLSEEEPDTGPDDAWTDEDRESDDGDERAPRTGRLVAPDEGAHPDNESDEVAFDAGIDGGGASAEEAAMHIVRE